MAVKPIPEGYHTLTAYLAVEDADRAIEFYKDAFGAEELFRCRRRTAGSVTRSYRSAIRS